jgi:hypothetical protein
MDLPDRPEPPAPTGREADLVAEIRQLTGAEMREREVEIRPSPPGAAPRSPPAD